jgi:predicted hotdog family 3-hydroxylacyl-ACP dehydratase
MALHGALMAADANAPPVTGFLASVRGVDLHVSRLDDVQADLVAKAERITGDQRTVLYEFSLAGGDRLLLSGRATIVLAASPDRSRT